MAAADKPATLWQVAEGKQTASFGLPSISTESQALSPDGKLLAIGTWRHEIMLFNTDNGSLLRTLHGHEGQVRGVAFSPDGHFLASAGEDRKLTLWDTQTWAPIRSYTLSTDGIMNTLQFSSDGAILYLAGMNTPILAWRVRDLTPLRTFVPANNAWQAVSLSPDDSKVAARWNQAKVGSGGVIDSKPFLTLYNARTGAVIWTQANVANDIFASPLVFSPNGQLLAMGMDGGAVKVLHVMDSTTIYTIKPTQAVVGVAPYSRTGFHAGWHAAAGGRWWCACRLPH